MQVLRFRFADDLHAPRLDVFVIAGKREARLLHARPQDRAIEAVVAGDELQRKLIELAVEHRAHRGLDENLDRHAGNQLDRIKPCDLETSWEDADDLGR